MIEFNKENQIFRLETQASTYCIKIADDFVCHAYYGPKLANDDVTYLTRIDEPPFTPGKNEREMHSFLDCVPQELPADGLGDFRESAVSVTDSQGRNGVFVKYVSYKITKGAKKINGLPCVFSENEEDCSTLEILCEDPVLKLQINLIYVVFEKIDAIVRSVYFKNKGNQTLFIKKALSASFDMDNEDFDVITLHGSWARERQISRHSVHLGKQGVVSMRGETSHQEHPFVAVLNKNSGWNEGNVYAMNFIYSGNFSSCVQLNQFDSIRVNMGINSENFCWKLNENEEFFTPQVVLAFSQNGLNGTSHVFHELYKNHLIRSPYKSKPRPILINNWEATYFNFDTEKLLEIAKEAAKSGIEMLVMDDGWFGKRNSDNCSLGDWTVNEEKIKGGLKNLVCEVNKLGLKFGIWFEPEMISPKSNLFTEHPDWAIQIPGRKPGLSREQLVLDITRKEVRDYAYNCVSSILKSANIEYVKWDMNRQLSDIGSICLSKDQTGEFYHRYVLSLYEMQERLVNEFPDLLLENCSGGGARFDPGMLYFSPQIWCSDDTDAIERLGIQEGTLLMYPASTIGSHVSVCPNHACGRNTPFKTRGYVAMTGTFGYELDITKLSEDEKNMISHQIELYKKYNEIIQNGDYYKIASYAENNNFDCWQFVKKDKSQAIVTFVQVLNHPNYKSRFIKINGLDENKNYKIEFIDENQDENPPSILSGLTLKNAGLKIKRPWGDFESRLIQITRID